MSCHTCPMCGTEDAIKIRIYPDVSTTSRLMYVEINKTCRCELTPEQEGELIEAMYDGGYR